MKIEFTRIMRVMCVVALSAALMTPVVDAQDRGRGGRERNAPTHRPASRPGTGGSHNNRPGGGQGQRPNRPGNSNNNNRPGGNQGNNNHNRPGNNQGNNSHNRPGGNQGNNNHNRPGNNHGNNNRPGGGNNHNRPGGNHNRPGNDRPGGPGGPHARPPQTHRPGGPAMHGPSHRPHMRPPRPFYRPVPPPHWRPAPHWRPFRSILGITLGTGFNISVNALINSGYTVAGYGNNEIYLTDVSMLNLPWPDAIMYYNNAGALYGSRFMYSTPYYDMNRYNMAYTMLSNSYGAPYSIENLANGMEATWWGTGNQFIRLSFISDYANNGTMRYFTTLSFGN